MRSLELRVAAAAGAARATSSESENDSRLHGQHASTPMRIAIIFRWRPSAAGASTRTAALREAGFRAGGARAAVLDLMAGQDCCASAQEIHETLRGAAARSGSRRSTACSTCSPSSGSCSGSTWATGSRASSPRCPTAITTTTWSATTAARSSRSPTPRSRPPSRSASERLGYSVDAHEVVLRGECGDCRDAP